MDKFLDLNGLTYFSQKVSDTFVKKESGKGLSSNDFTDADKQKLDGLSNLSVPIATDTVIGGILSTSGEGGVNVNSTGNATVNGVPTISGANNLTGANTFTQPVTVGAPTANNHAATKTYVDSNAVLTSGNQTISGTKTFNNDLLVVKQSTKEIGKGVVNFQRKEGYDVGKVGIILNSLDQFTVQATRGDLVLDSTSGSINVNSRKVTNLATPTVDTDAASKQYVDTSTSAINTQITDINSKLTKLIGVAIQFIGKDTAHSTAQYKGDNNLITTFVTSQGHTLGRGQLVIDNDNDTWYYTGTQWENWGPFSVATATNTTLGIVKGSTADGNVSINSDGSMSVNGFQSFTPIQNSEIDAMFNT